MTTIASTDMSNMMIARRLMMVARDAEARRNGKHVDDKSALDYYEEDQAFISASASSANDKNLAPTPVVENINVNLQDVHQQVAATNGGQVAHEALKLEASQSIEVSLELRFRSNSPMEGLLVHDKNYAESDRYLFNFKDGATFTILDKWSNKSTTVWGDPHIDVDDVEGANNGDFQDLKASDDVTTFMLEDGARVTFLARDTGIIEQVDIFKGSQHVSGIGQASSKFSPQEGLFSTKVQNDGVSAALSTPQGDVVYAGGDGNDWYDSSNQLVWGRTTGPVVLQRPSAVLEFSYKQTITQSVSIQTVVRQA